MSKRRLFNGNDSCPDINISISQKMSPNRGGVHPALLNHKTPESGSKIQKTPASNAQPREAVKKSKPDSAMIVEPDSDSDQMEVPGFFTSVPKLPYTREEDELILKYVLQGQNIFKVGSILLWRHLEAKKDNPKRTYQSLKNRFLRNIKPYLFTRFGHLTKDKATMDRIVTKFPELKPTISRREVLSRIKLPQRKLPSQVIEEDTVSSTSTNESQGILGSIPTSRPHAPADLSVSEIHSERIEPETTKPKSLNSDSLKSVIYERIVRTESDGITVLVNFKSKKYVETPSLGIYETYLKLKRKNTFHYCPTCGRYSAPTRAKQFICSTETDIIPNSVETPGRQVKSTKAANPGSILKSNTPSKQKTNSQPLSMSPCSPSLLSEVAEVGEIDKCSPDKPVGNSQVVSRSLRKYASQGSNKLSQVQGSSTAGEKANDAERRSKTVRMAAASTSSSNRRSSGRSSKRRKDSDEDMDSMCEDTMENFRKLINDEEEQNLVRKCLNKNIKTIGLDEVPFSNWDSYFLESSSDLETPPLTIDYETDSQNNTSEEPSETTNSFGLTKNVKKISGGKKKNLDKDVALL